MNCLIGIHPVFPGDKYVNTGLLIPWPLGFVWLSLLFLKKSSSLFAGLSLVVRGVLGDLPVIESKGSKLFYSNNGTQLCVFFLPAYVANAY